MPPEQRDRVAELLQQTRRLTSVAENLLLLSRADTGRLALRATSFNLRGLLEGCMEDARVLGEKSNLKIEANLPETLPVRGDRDMVELALQNLVENAVKYNRPGGKILLSAGENGEGVQICVGNSGRGIPPEQTPHIFKRFYRARGDEQTPGHGLGLSIARELARAHGGDLTLTESREDWTEFCLRLGQPSLTPAVNGETSVDPNSPLLSRKPA